MRLTAAEDTGVARRRLPRADIPLLAGGAGKYIRRVSEWPALRWPQLRRVLTRAPLLYRIVRQTGSHLKLESASGYPQLHLAYHDRSEIPGGQVRRILVDGVGLTENEARTLL